MASGLTSWFDQNRDDKIDFREYCFSISSVTKGPAPERAKHIFHILRHTADTLSHRDETGDGDKAVTVQTISKLITNEPLPPGADSTVDAFMIGAVSTGTGGAIDDLLRFYSDLAHLAFGLIPESKADEMAIVDRFESKWSRPTAVGWLISAEWWRRWRKDKDLKPSQIDNKSLFQPRVGTPEVFVFEDRGQIPVADLKAASIPVSRITLDFLSDIYGAPAVMVCRPIIGGVVSYDVLVVNIFRHKYAQAQASTTSTDKELEIELDGVALIWPCATVQTVRTDLTKVKRQSLENIRIWQLKDGKERSLLDDETALFSGMGDSGKSDCSFSPTELMLKHFQSPSWSSFAVTTSAGQRTLPSWPVVGPSPAARAQRTFAPD